MTVTTMGDCSQYSPTLPYGDMRFSPGPYPGAQGLDRWRA